MADSNGRDYAERRFDNVEQSLVRFEGRIETLILTISHLQETSERRIVALENSVAKNKDDLDAFHNWKRTFQGQVSGVSVTLKVFWTVMGIALSAGVGAAVTALVTRGS